MTGMPVNETDITMWVFYLVFIDLKCLPTWEMLKTKLLPSSATHINKAYVHNVHTLRYLSSKVCELLRCIQMV